ncbi:nucleoside recognition domain-containing protein [Desulfuribacillus alkaliarsenatis]|uniref:Nucleoside recognition protein n=1 Tax=Desulfuribacillus alkaliarsenatis TaxID=766136 RepID=A0A1E5G5N6_9FIRM|nr:nucleoside recognition domain-containing protein [Desulfuribacillus alkaliarsenatis]OEF98500.1 nucleoside recognition protein [Desulfuribacillus alkaliarsenatis]
MINGIWLFFVAFGIGYSALAGNIDQVTSSILKGAELGVGVSLGLISILVFWLGIVKIAEKAGLIDKLSILLSPIAKFLFPEIPKNHPAMGYILSNMSANMLGIGNAATPLGLKAMEELQKLNKNKEVASKAMCTLLALNTSSITLIPTTIIGLRLKFESADPTEIVFTTIFATLISTFVAISVDKYYRRKERHIY